MSAFVVSYRNVVIPHPDGGPPCHLTRGYAGPVPDWVPGIAYFKALEADGKIVLSTSRKDKDLRRAKAAADKARKTAEKAVQESAAPVGDSVEEPDVSRE